MAVLLMGLSGLVGIVNLAAFIIVLSQRYKAKGVGHGIAGTCCGLYTLVWGWQNHAALDASNPPVIITYKQWMQVWTGCIVVSIVLNVMTQAMARM